jgi:DNA-binding GntR family transcriptional regulator
MDVTQTSTKREHGALREHVVEQLRAEIIDGRLEPGTPLRTEAVMERFGVSNSPLREAFAQLSAEGLIEVYRNRGAVVAPLTHEAAADLLRVSALHWETAFRWAVPRLTGSDLSAVRRAAVDFDLAYRSGDAVTAVLDADRFDQMVLERCGSEELQRTVQASSARVARVQRFIGPYEQLDMRAQVQSETLASVAVVDADRAGMAVRAAWANLVELLDRSSMGVTQ